MDTLKSLYRICECFKNKDYSIKEFQSRLNTLLISDKYKSLVETSINEAVNRLEEIIYTSTEVNYYKYGIEVADKLILEVKELV